MIAETDVEISSIGSKLFLSLLSTLLSPIKSRYRSGLIGD